MKLKNNIVITGTSSGLGYELAKVLSKKNNVICLSRTKGNLLREKNNKNIFFLPFDLTNKSDVNETLKFIFKKFKKIDCLINNASIFNISRINEHNEINIEEIINTNLLGSIYLTRKLIQYKKSKSHTKIISINSVSGLGGIADQSVYSASKHGMRGFFNSLAIEQDKNLFSFHNIYPGGIKTKLWSKINNINKRKYNNFLNTKDIVPFVKLIIDSPNNMVVKNLTLYPTGDWH